MRNILILVLVFFLPSSVYAVECSVSVSPANVLGNIFENFVFSVNNLSSSETYKWVKFSLSTEDIDFGTPTADGWSASGDRAQSVFTNSSGGVGPGQSQSFNIDESGIGNAPASFSVNTEVSTSADGSGFGSCNAVTINIVTTLPTNPEITNVSLATGATSATVTWSTDISSTSLVDYGTTASYGSSVTGSLATSHSLTMSGLTASTTYHYKLTNVSESGGSTSTVDLTFTTGAVNTVTTTTIVTTTTTNTVTNTVTKIVEVKDTAPPNLSLATNFKKVYAVAPEITGQATDPSGVSLVEYTLDAGKNWLPVDNIAKRFAKSSAFSFLPENLLDGNYPLKVRVTDGAGNIGFSPAYTLIIDRLPPSVGLGLWSFGPQILESTVVEGMTARVALSAVGGPTEIVLCIKYQAICEETKLTKNEETGLWMADVKFSVDGDYGLEVRSIDGADNRTEGELGVVRVLPSGVVEPPGTVTVYYYEPSWGRFQIWDGQAFGQSNPVKTPDSGKYFLLLPPGKYYLEAGSPNFRTARTGIFTLPKTSVVNMHFVLLPKLNWWPWDQIDEVVWVSADDSPITNSTNPALPFFALPDTADKLVYNSSLRGVPTVLTFLASWTPTVSEQVTELEKVASNKNYKAMVVFAQEPLSLAKIFQKRGDYKLTMVADPDGELLKPLGVASVPTHVFIDRKGLITKVIKGVLSAEEIILNF